MNSLLMYFSECLAFSALIKISLLLCLLWLVYLGLPKVNPPWRCRIWRLGAVLLCAVALLSVAPPQFEIEVVQHIEPGESSFTSEPDAAQADFASIDSKDDRLLAQNSQTLRQSAPTPLEFESDPVASATSDSVKAERFSSFLWPDFQSLVTQLWLAGIAILVARWAVVASRSWRAWMQRLPASADQHLLVNDLAKRFGIDRPPSVFRSRVKSPCATCFPRPSILLPTGFNLDSESSQAVYAHELAHLKRHDWYWNLVFVILETLLWFHPLVWKIRSSHLNECEKACDDLAAEITGSRSRYQKILAHVALDQCGQNTAVGLSMVRKPQIMNRLLRLGVPASNFSISRLAWLSSTATIVAVAFSMSGVALVQPQDREVIPPETAEANEFSFTLNLPESQLEKTLVEVHWYEKDNQKPFRKTFRPDEDGLVQGQLGDKPLSHATIVLRSPGCVPYAITRHARNRKIVLPNDESISLKKGYPLSGSVLDANGDPIAGAVVSIDIKAQDSRDPRRFFELANVKTERDGSWSIDTAPWNLRMFETDISVSHPDYMTGRSSVPDYPTDEAVSKAVLAKGLKLGGTVKDSDGYPIKGVRVSFGRQQSGILPKPTEDFTDEDGKFELNRCRPGSRFVVATKKGYAPELIQLDLDETLAEQPIDIQLGAGKTIRARLIDQNGDPVNDALVAIQTWREDHSLPFRTRTDEEGRFVWKDAPEDSVWFTFSGKNHRLIVHHELKHSPEEQRVLLHTRQRVRLKIIDDETEEPIINSYVQRGLRFSMHDERAHFDGKWTPSINGELDFECRRSVPETWLKFHSPGYQIKIKKFKLGEPDKDVTVRLVRANEETDAKEMREKVNQGIDSKSENEAQSALTKLGAKVKRSEDGIWKIKLTGPLDISSATFGVPNITKPAGRQTWTGQPSDLLLLKKLKTVELTLDGFYFNAEILEQLARLRSLSVLNLDGCRLDLSDDECALLAKLESLREIYLDGRWQTFPKEALEGLAELPHLHTLDFDGCGTFGMNASTLMNRLSRFKSLKTLVLNCNGGFEDDIAPEICELDQLQSLSVRGRKISDKFLEQIADLNLKSLNLAMTGISDRGLLLVAESYPELTELNIERTGVTKDGIKSVMNQFPNLRKLTVSTMGDRNNSVLLDFKRAHIDCSVHPIGYGVGSVYTLGPIVLPEEETDR